MLIANRRKIRISQVIYASLVLSFAIIAVIPITVQFNTILIQNELVPPDYFYDTTREQMIAAGGFETFFLNNPLIFLLSLLLGSLTIIFYIPGMSSLGLTKSKGHKKFRITKYRLPEYGYTIPVDGIQFRIKRKLNSLKGLFLRELDLLIILPGDYKGDKRLFDFLACEQVYYTSKQIILRKTVDIQNLPLLFVRAKILVKHSR
ncbi:MAG: hypothetical protein ACXAC6_07520 [Candidatus Hodarchaeales archaeon]|jgi:hypothetical protein